MKTFRLVSITLLAAPLLAGCLERGEPPPVQSTLAEDDDTFCRANGKYTPTSPEYVYCRRDRDAQRNQAQARADRRQRDLGDYMMSHPERPQ
ncbi:hypothetical protein [Bradyrhizobium sp. NP1]|uniref:hypothetical protein n=1 Tax=Bradyrhizobium sp. NP1 TaxID=3049772 RepID=UPI0025A527F3|nr:hypothetical protein [Bradyrhizobium sp. NP1]WJR79096.1 hypothetical protein QOU61_04670 [Bradyrhizobium sp. NP1]